jgi:hypothetical protein
MKRMEKIVYIETKYFPRIKNSWGWIKKDIEYNLDLEQNFISFGFEQNKILFEEIIEFFKSY